MLELFVLCISMQGMYSPNTQVSEKSTWYGRRTTSATGFALGPMADNLLEHLCCTVCMRMIDGFKILH